LSRHEAARHGPLGDRKERLALGALEHVEHSGLGRLDHRRYGDTFHFDIHEHGLRGQVEIPQVVMYELLVPDELAGTGVEREKRVCKAVVSEPGAAVEVRTRRSRRDVYQAMVLVDRHDAPGVA